ncbi:MAG: sensor histidine kinase [Vicinamibacterales bacterium]
MIRPSALVVVTLALLVLVPTLAVLQYRWVGQVSEAERERMQTTVRNAAIQFRETLDGEIARAAINLQVGAVTAREGSSDRYSDRHDAWSSTAAHPQLVANIYLIDPETDTGDAVRLRRWNTATHVFEPAGWPAVLQPWQAYFRQELAGLRAGRGFERRMPPPDVDESIVLVPLRPPPQQDDDRRQAREPIYGFTVLQLDLDYIGNEMLPELAQRFFLVNDDNGYRVAVRAADEPDTVIYQSHPGAMIDPVTADAVEPLFGIRAAGFFIDRGVRARRGAVINVFRGRDGQPNGRWMLVAQHQIGSLDAAVTRARNRNLGIGFGILLLLSLSVGMLALSSRRAQRLARQQMEFVAGVSHELRTPVAVIRSAAENLSHGVVGHPDRVKQYGDAIGTEARRLGEMVENVMQYAGLESGRALAAQSPLAVDRLIDEALREAAPAIAAAGVTVERRTAQDLPLVGGDASALRSALQNLIANAVKYGGSAHWVGVRAEAVRGGRHGQVRITVEDRGGGIPAADLPHIFEPFYRGTDVVAQQIHGNGLGLSIVKRIVTAHGGDVAVSTRAGEGSAFSVTLPALDPAAAAAAEAGASAFAGPGAEARS